MNNNGKKFEMLSKSYIKMLAVAFILFICGSIICLFVESKSQADEIKNIQKQQTETTQIINKVNEQTENIQESLATLRERHDRLRTEVSRQASRAIKVTVTAYDLSPQSCGKYPGSPGYGVTASGVCLAGHTLESARAIAVDPSVIPLGSKVRIKFDNPNWSHLNGVYTAVDTGGAIGGNRIDLFMGEGSYNECMSFGTQQATVYYL